MADAHRFRRHRVPAELESTHSHWTLRLIHRDRGSIVRLVGAVLAEQTDEWTEARRYIGLDILAKCRMRIIAGDTPMQNPLPQTLTA